VLYCGKHRSKTTQKSKIITSARLKISKTPEVNHCRGVSDKTVTTNGIRQKWDYGKCDSMETCARTMHFTG
jgi:hypothetical protein